MKQVALGQQGIKGADINAVGKRNIPIQLSLSINPATATLATSQGRKSIHICPCLIYAHSDYNNDNINRLYAVLFIKPTHGALEEKNSAC